VKVDVQDDHTLVLTLFLLGHESRAPFMRKVTFRNLDILHFSMTSFLLEPGEDTIAASRYASRIRPRKPSGSLPMPAKPLFPAIPSWRIRAESKWQVSE
jgi:hypothetical protein